MKHAILKLMMEYWEEYKDNTATSNISFEGFMNYLEVINN